jgi:hypothetical protein
VSLFWESVIAGLTSGKRLAKVWLKPGGAVLPSFLFPRPSGLVDSRQ